MKIATKKLFNTMFIGTIVSLIITFVFYICQSFAVINLNCFEWGATERALLATIFFSLFVITCTISMGIYFSERK